MKLLELDIANVRGIKATNLRFDGSNLVILGPNGSGKSAVVDAIDFLLTGRISRLTGEGTSGISLKRHGPHIDHDAKEASVTARVQIAGLSGPITLHRELSTPGDLQYPPAAAQALLPVLALASRGQQVLSRREILRYIAAEAGKRAQEVQALLNLSDVEGVRKALTRVLNTALLQKNSSSSRLLSAQNSITATLGLTAFDPRATLGKVNELRGVLGGDQIGELSTTALKSGVVSPLGAYQPSAAINVVLLRGDLESVLSLSRSGAGEPDARLRRSLEQLRADQGALKEARRLQLMELGVSLIDESGICPLCETQWAPGELKRRLSERIAGARVIKRTTEEVHGLAAQVSASADTCRSHLRRLHGAATTLGLTGPAGKLLVWEQNLTLLISALESPLERYLVGPWDERSVASLLAPQDAGEVCAGIVSEAEAKYAPPSREGQAWDTLTRLEENWKQYEEADREYTRAVAFRSRAEQASECFEDSRDEVLAGLYKAVESRFVALYRMIHPDDEGSFETSLRHQGAKLHLEVDFYGRGKHPPLALHSEGHQDTMGLVLYLALAERLTGDLIKLTILDDVVMSVDSGHRRQVCKMLATAFPETQFLITTHDRTWARELEIEGVVPRQNVVEFSRWTIDDGPRVSAEGDLWNKIQADMERGDVPAAAGRLRRGMEHFCEFVCHNLQARVRYRADGRYEPSDLMDGAIKAYRDLLRRAKSAAQSWKNLPLLTQFTEAETVAHQIIDRSQAERWAVNANVHYNRWIDFSADDFRPVAEAMQDLFDMFRCVTCKAVLAVTTVGLEPATVCCRCGKVSWNLLKKEPAAPL